MKIRNIKKVRKRPVTGYRVANFAKCSKINSKLQYYGLLREQSSHGGDNTMHFKFH